MSTRAIVSMVWSGNERLRRWRRKSGKRPKIWMEKSVRLKTDVVVGRREARTVEAMTAALVDREDGYVFWGGRVFVAGVEVVTGARGAIEAAVLVLVSGAREDAGIVKEVWEALVCSVPFAWMVAGGVAAVLALWLEIDEGTYWLP